MLRSVDTLVGTAQCNKAVASDNLPVPLAEVRSEADRSETTTTPARGRRCSPFTPRSSGYKLANDGQDTRAIQHYLGHRNIQQTTR